MGALLPPFQECEHLEVRGVGKEIKRDNLPGLVDLFQAQEVPRQGGGIARYIGQPLCPDLADRGDRFPGQPFSRRVDHKEIDPPGLKAAGGLFGFVFQKKAVMQPVEAGILPGGRDILLARIDARHLFRVAGQKKLDSPGAAVKADDALPAREPGNGDKTFIELPGRLRVRLEE